MSHSVTGTLNGENAYILRPRVPTGQAIIWHHGGGGETTLYDPLYGQVNGRALQDGMVASGFTIVSCDFGGAQTWADPANQTALTNAVAALNTFGCRTDRVALWGTSMGFACLATWAKNNAAKVACLFGTIPCTDSQWAYTNGTTGSPTLQTAMDGAWSGNWQVNGKPTTDPSVIFASLTTFPIQCCYATDDTTVGATTSPTFVAAVNGAGGNATATPMGTGNHTDVPVAYFNTPANRISAVGFMQSGNWA